MKNIIIVLYTFAYPSLGVHRVGIFNYMHGWGVFRSYSRIGVKKRKKKRCGQKKKNRISYLLTSSKNPQSRGRVQISPTKKRKRVKNSICITLLIGNPLLMCLRTRRN